MMTASDFFWEVGGAIWRCLGKVFSVNEWRVRRLWKRVKEINSLEPEVQKWSDEDFKAKTEEFKNELRAYTENERIEYERKREQWLRCKDPEERRRLEEELALADKALKDKEQEYLRKILPLAFAMVREAARRTLNMRHFDVQIMGGIVLHEGKIAEMKTGEGKTLVATLPLYLNALTGRGVHLVTVNDYLAKRDAEWMGPIYEYLGLTVGYIQHFMGTEERQANYRCDVTYVTNTELGFDYLRDNLAWRLEDTVLRELFYAIIDEVDSILIDEARTPLIISGVAEKPTDIYYKVDRVVRKLKPEVDYTVDEKARTVSLTDEGLQKVERELGVENLSDPINFELFHYVMNALKAHTLFHRDVDYIVKDGEVILVDEFTGRLMFGRRYSDGLHQAIEAKEGVKIQRESQTVATITLQNFFRMYYKLAGMTGTAKTEEREFIKIYGMPVVVIPTHKPMIRVDHPDIVYKTQEAKFRGIVAEILNCHCRQQPVLVGTRSVAVSEFLSERLKPHYLQLLALCYLTLDRIHSKYNAKELSNEDFNRMRQIINTPLEKLDVVKARRVAKEVGLDPDVFNEENLRRFAELIKLEPNEEMLKRLSKVLSEGIPHNVLNAKHHEREAQIIAEAGRLGAVTVATNMAGRGVDIILGGKPDKKNHPEEICDDENCKVHMIHNKQYHEVVKLGGLHIIGTERHESRRIDNQLRGRSGRQGDPGSSRFYVSLQDEWMRLYGDKLNHPWLRGWWEEMPIESRIVSKAMEKAQQKVEAHNFEIRKHTLRYDDVMNMQREVIYSDRRKVLEGADMRANVIEMLKAVIESVVDSHLSEALPPENWDFKAFMQSMRQFIPIDELVKVEELKGLKQDEIKELIFERALEFYERKEKMFGEEAMRDYERRVVLWAISTKWIDHLANMDYLRDHIHLRAYGQRDPFIEYQREAYEMFQQLLQSIREEVVRWAFYGQPEIQQRQTRVSEVRERHDEVTKIAVEETDAEATIASAEERTDVIRPVRVQKVGRNDPCPCGSGKKYKKCCMLKEMEKSKARS
jgi:preprotein translocase subunit SecA